MHEVAVVAFPGISPFHLAVPSTVFARALAQRPDPALPRHGLRRGPRAAAAPTPGYDLLVDARARRPRRGADRGDPELATSTVDAVRRPARRGPRARTPAAPASSGSASARSSSPRPGSSTAARWRRTGPRRRSSPGGTPSATVRSDVLWCDLGDVVTSAGVAAALDCCLHVRPHRPRRRVRRRRGARRSCWRRTGTAARRSTSRRPWRPTPSAPTRSRSRWRWAAARLDDAARPRHLGGERAPVAADVHAAVPRAHRREPVAVAAAPAPGARPGAARVDRRTRRAGRARRPGSARRRRCASTSRASSAPARASTGRRSARRP